MLTFIAIFAFVCIYDIRTVVFYIDVLPAPLIPFSTAMGLLPDT